MPATDERYIENAQRFEPERWEKGESVTDLQRRGVYSAFGSGPRMCPGRSLALLQIRLVLSMLYRNFDVERVGASKDVDELFAFNMNPQGLRIRLHHR